MSQREGSSATSRRERIALCVFCLLGGSEWLIEGALPSPLPGVARQGVHALVLGVSLSVLLWARRRTSRIVPRNWSSLAMVSVLLLGIPAALLEWAQGGVSPSTVVGLFALGPVVVIVLSAANAGGTASPLGGGLVGALAGLGGILLLLPIQAPATAHQVAMYSVVVFAVVLSATAAVWMHRLLAEATFLQAANVWLVSNGLLLCAGWMLTAAPEHLAWPLTPHAAAIEAAVALLFDLPQALLLIWLLRQLAPARLSARYVLVPLVTVIEGLLLLRPEFTVRMGIGLALAAFGIWRLMTSHGVEEQPASLLG